jgi:uncharacterized protein
MATVIFKPTEACNARCVYCDVVHKESRAVRTMSKEVLELLFVRINEYLTDRPDDDMEIIWHGGEPLLLGTEYFETALAFQERHCAKTSSRINHSIQSNLTVLTPDLVRVLKKIGIGSIGSSYDPYTNLRGLGEGVDAAEYRRRFVRGVALLEKEGMGCGIIYVVTRLSLERPLEIFYNLTNFRIDGAVNINPVIIYHDNLNHLKITPEEYADFLGAIFPVWWRNRSRYPHVGPFRSLIRNFVDGERHLSCGDSGNCANTHLNLAPDGRLSQCGRSSDWKLLDYGSINDKTFSQVFSDPQREVLRDRNRVLSEGECNGCRFWDICHGGCPLDSWYESGSFQHKSFWCQATKDFIEKYVEPIVFDGSKKKTVTLPQMRADATERGLSSPHSNPSSGEQAWINPVGGLGDTLMLSGVLKHVAERTPDRKFNLVKRTKYGPLLEGHPAIARIGHPPPGAEFITTDYWSDPDYGTGPRAYQLLARRFGLKTPVEERLYVPWPLETDRLLLDRIPRGNHNVILCPTSDSPRKQIGIEKWVGLVDSLRASGVCIVQVGRHSDPYVRGTYNLLGLTNPRELISLLPHFDAVVTSDNFIMHAAHLCNVPAVVLWGPTSHRVYGYEEQAHFQVTPDCSSAGGCIGAGKGLLYNTPCPEPAHCMDRFDMEEIGQAVRDILKKRRPESAA